MENDSITGEELQPEPIQESDVKGDSDVIQILQTFWQNILDNKKLAVIIRRVIYGIIAFFGLFFLFLFFIFIIPAIQELPSGHKSAVTNSSDLKKDAAYKKQIAAITRDVQRLTRKHNSYTSGISYVVINTTDNLFYLYKNKKLVREGHCSTGSLKMLMTEEGRSWIFKTPRGKYTIQGKQTNPVWTRPDWAYVEEGLPIPPKDDPSRYEPNVLGDYKLTLGDGYMIHGTIYKRFLGMPVTHGCVRLNDEDLKAIFNTLSIGSKVYIF